MSERTLSVLDGSTFVVGDRCGDVRADEGREHGFFSEDTRFISRWLLRVGPTPLELLSLHQSAHFDAQFFLTPTVGPDDQAPLSIVRQRLVDRVWMEEITVTNHLHETACLRVVLEVAADFADLFEVKNGVVAEREIRHTRDEASLTLAYEHGPFHRSVTITGRSPAAVTGEGFEYELELNQLNRSQAPEIESVYLMSSPKYSFISSSGVKELATFGGEIGDLVPDEVAGHLKERLGR